MNRLLNIGFIPVGHWTLNNDEFKFKLTYHHMTTNVLYSFISNGEVKYIGKTTMQLSRRMYGYQNPGPSQTTNMRVCAKLKDLLMNDMPVDIFILVDNGLLSYGDFRINLAAGLEDTLIHEINPDWNLSGRSLIPTDADSEKSELSKDPQLDSSIPKIMTTIEISLGRTYFNQAFFNVTTGHSNLIGTDGSAIQIQLGNNSERTIQGYINRTANSNGTPRIMGGQAYRTWIQDNFNLNEIMKVDIISPNSIRIYKG